MACISAVFCVLLLLVISEPTLGKPQNQDLCTYQYAVQPYNTIEPESCSPIGTAVNIACAVNGPPGGRNYGIQWHTSRSVEEAGQSTATVISPLPTERYGLQEITSRMGGINYRYSELTIHDFQEEDYGYYWCVVTVDNTELPTPSEILLIAEPCNPTQCDSPLNLYEPTSDLHCANIIEDSEVITPPTSLECPQPMTTQFYMQPTSTIHDEATATTPNQAGNVVTFASTQTSDTTSSTSASGYQPSPTLDLPLSHSSNVNDISLPTEILLQPSPTKVDSTGSDTESNKDAVSQSLIWLTTVVAVAIVLAAIAFIVTLIVCIHCKKRRIKANTYNCSNAYASEEARRSSTLEEDNQGIPHSGTGPKAILDHDYSEIPNFLENPNSSCPVYQNVPEDSGTSEAKAGYDSLPGMYEDVLPPDPTQIGRRHQYDKVIENGSPNYNRLQHQNSVKQHTPGSRQSSIKLQLSNQLSTATTVSTVEIESDPADLAQTIHQHIDIYHSASSSDDDYSRLERSPQLGSTDQPLLESSTLWSSQVQQSASDLNQQNMSPGTAVEAEQLELQYFVIQAAPPAEDTIASERQYHHLEPPTAATPASTEPPETEAVYTTPSKRVPQANRTSEDDAGYHHLERSLSINGSRQATTTSECERSTEYHRDSYSQLFDDIQYSRLEQPAVEKGEKTKKGSTLPNKTAQDNLFEMLYATCTPEIANDLQESSAKSGSRYNHLEKHKYTPVITTQQDSHNVYSLPIVSTPEMYVSERGHVYQVLEASVET